MQKSFELQYLDDIRRGVHRFFFGHIKKKAFPAFLFDLHHLSPKLVDFLTFHDEHDTHGAADLVFSHPLQFGGVLVQVGDEVFIVLGGPSGFVGVEHTHIALLVLEKKVGVAGGSAQHAEEESCAHDVDQCLEVLWLWLVQADSSHDQHDQVISVSHQLVVEDAAVVTHQHTVGQVELLQYCLHQKSGLARRVPLTRLFMRKQLGRYLRENLNREGLQTIIPEKGDDGFRADMIPPAEEVGQSHLEYSEHAAPAGIGGVVSGRQSFLDVRAVGKTDILFVVGHFGAEQRLHHTCYHFFSDNFGIISTIMELKGYKGGRAWTGGDNQMKVR